MWPLRERLWVILEWNKSYIELITLYEHPKNSNHLRSHLRAIMALDHSRLGLENWFLENKSGWVFCVWQVLYKILPTNLGACQNQPFLLFIHHIWAETVLRGAVFIIQTSDRMQYVTIFQDKLHSINIQDHRSTHGLLAKPLKKISKSPIRSAGSQFWQAPNLQWPLLELRFIIIKNLLCLFFIKWFYNQKAFDTRAILSTTASDVHERLKTNGKAIKIAKETN